MISFLLHHLFLSIYFSLNYNNLGDFRWEISQKRYLHFNCLRLGFKLDSESTTWDQKCRKSVLNLPDSVWRPSHPPQTPRHRFDLLRGIWQKWLLKFHCQLRDRCRPRNRTRSCCDPRTAKRLFSLGLQTRVENLVSHYLPQLLIVEQVRNFVSIWSVDQIDRHPGLFVSHDVGSWLL